jgi:ribonucleoside-diphosphate reductase alpha chain
MDFYKNNILPYVQTDYLIEEVANLKLKQLSSGKYTVEQATKRVDKDRYSSLAYALWYIENYENTKEVKKINYTNYLFISQNS